MQGKARLAEKVFRPFPRGFKGVLIRQQEYVGSSQLLHGGDDGGQTAAFNQDFPDSHTVAPAAGAVEFNPANSAGVSSSKFFIKFTLFRFSLIVSVYQP